jgi:Na+/melibiose symporter-like transporter
MKLSERTYTGEFPPKSTLWTYYLSAFFYEAFFEFITLFVVLYVQLASPIASSGDPQLYQTMLMAVIFGLVGVKILTAVFYTLAGHALEGVVTTIGRYRLFILTGSAACSFFFILLFFVAPLLSGWYYVVFFLFFFILMEFCYTFNDIAFWAYLNTLTRDEKHKGIYSSFLNSFSLFGSYLVASLSPAIMAGEAKRNMTLMAAILIVFYLLSQLVMGLFMWERKEDVSTLPKEKTNPLLAWKILFKDKQIGVTILAFFLLFIAQDLVIGNASNYFYFEFGYGSFQDAGYQGQGPSGGYVSFFFTVCFGIGNLLSEFAYPFVARKLNKKQILLWSSLALCFFYLFLFFYAFKRNNEIALYLSAAGLAFSHGLVFTPMFLNCFDSSEYYEVTYHHNRNGSIQSLKNVAAILANAVQTALFYVFLSVSGLLGANSEMANLEARKASGEVFTDFIGDVNQAILSSSGPHSNEIYLSGLTLLPLVLSLAAIFLTIRFVRVNDEKQYQAMVDTLKARQENPTSGK